MCTSHSPDFAEDYECPVKDNGHSHVHRYVCHLFLSFVRFCLLSLQTGCQMVET